MTRRRGHGRRQREAIVSTIVWGIEELTGLESYAPADERTPRSRKDARGPALHAVVAEDWNGTACPAGQETVFLINWPVQEALRVLDVYDDRSLMDPCINTEAK